MCGGEWAVLLKIFISSNTHMGATESSQDYDIYTCEYECVSVCTCMHECLRMQMCVLIRICVHVYNYVVRSSVCGGRWGMGGYMIEY